MRSSPCTCAFFRAGASIATTASYQASFDGFAERGIGRDDAARLLRRSVELAKAARDEVGGDRRGWPRPSGRTARRWPTARNTSAATVFRSRSWRTGTGRGWRSLPTPDADVLALETVPDVDEAEALVGARSRARCSGVAVLHDRRDDDARRATARRRVRGRRRRAGNRCGGRELLRARRRRACDRRGPGDRPESPSSSTPTAVKTGTASAERGSDRSALVGRPRAAMGRRGRAHHRRVLPGAAGRHRRHRGERRSGVSEPRACGTPAPCR